MKRALMSMISVFGAAIALLVAPTGIPAAHASGKVPLNPNPIDWTITDSFATQVFDDFVPLRQGQHDFGTEDGFGVLHIIDGHGFVPSHAAISAALAVGECVFQSPNDTWLCNNGELTVALTTRMDSRAPDHRPVGIITAFECGCTLTAQDRAAFARGQDLATVIRLAHDRA